MVICACEFVHEDCAAVTVRQYWLNFLLFIFLHYKCLICGVNFCFNEHCTMTRLCFVLCDGCTYCNKTELSIFVLAPVSIEVSIGNEFRDILYWVFYRKNKNVAQELHVWLRGVWLQIRTAQHSNHIIWGRKCSCCTCHEHCGSICIHWTWITMCYIFF